MILNERQYRITRAAARKMADQLSRDTEPSSGNENDRQRWHLLLAGGTRQLRQLEEEMREYEMLRSGAIERQSISSLEELPIALIRARIVRGWTQARLAQELGMPEQQVQRYERERYRSANIQRLRRIAELLGVEFTGAAVMTARAAATKVEWRKPLLMMFVAALARIHGRVIRGRLEGQKLVLLLDRDLRRTLGWSAFSFEPYRFGGYDPHLDDDVDVLVHHGFLSGTRSGPAPDPAEASGRESLALTADARTDTWVRDFLADDRLADAATKQELMSIVEAVVRRYGHLSRSRLLKLTYQEIPESASRSEIHDQVMRPRR